MTDRLMSSDRIAQHFDRLDACMHRLIASALAALLAQVATLVAVLVRR